MPPLAHIAMAGENILSPDRKGRPIERSGMDEHGFASMSQRAFTRPFWFSVTRLEPWLVMSCFNAWKKYTIPKCRPTITL